MNTQQLEARSDAERGDVEDTIGQLRKRLSPGQLVDEVLAYTKDGGGEFVTNLGRQATNNPLPVTLIGAGLAWFMFSKGGSQAAPQSSTSNPSKRSSAGAGEPEANAPGIVSKIADTTSGAASAILDGASGAAGAVRDGVSAGEDRAADGAHFVSDSLSGASQNIKDGLNRSTAAIGKTAGSARRTATEYAHNATEFLKDQPLILLGAGFAVGAAVGASFPVTDAENEVLGESSSELKSQVKKAAASELETAQAAGEHLYGQVRENLGDEISHFADGIKTGNKQGNQITDSSYEASSEGADQT